MRTIRDEIHQQLVELWRIHTALKRLKWTAIVNQHPTFGPMSWPPMAYLPDNIEPPKGFVGFGQGPQVDLSEPIQVGARKVVPLVRKSLSLACRLNVLFLRKEDPGSLVFKAGDLDGRIKTLLDALKMPSADDDSTYPSVHDPLYCLMENDTLVTHLDVETDRLLLPIESKPTDAQLIIEVSIDVLEVGPWNVCLVGG